MKYLAPIILAFLALLGWLFFTGCSTRVYKDGKPVFIGYGDYRNLTYNADGSFHADYANHGVPTKKAFDGITETVTAVGGAGAALGLTPAIR